MKKDKPCARCGALMWQSPDGLPAGEAVCWPCRRIEPKPSGPRGPNKATAKPRKPPTYKNPPRTVTCKCGNVFTTHKVNQKYCTEKCRPPGHYTKASAASRGYGADHQRRRKALLPTAYGHRCPLCFEVMYQGQALDLDHTIPKAFGGTHGDRMTHASCNRKRGNQTKRMLRRGSPQTVRQATRAW